MPHRLTPLRAVALSISLLAGYPVMAEPAGAYLAARAATQDDNFQAAITYYDRLLDEGLADMGIADSALTAHIALGDYDGAVAIAKTLAAQPDAAQGVALTLLAQAARDGDYAKGLQLLDESKSVGPLFAGLYRAWALVGEGNMSDAVSEFDKVGKLQGLDGFAMYHKALALAQVGDYEGAEKILSGASKDIIHNTRRGVMTHIQVLSHLERDGDAIALLDDTFDGDLDPELEAVRAKLEAGEVLTFDMARDAREGIAELYFSIGAALTGDVPQTVPLVHARLAQWLNPAHADAILLTASMLDQQGQYDLAIQAYDEIPEDNAIFFAAQMGRADALVKADRAQEATDVLNALVQADPDLPGVWLALGDVERRQQHFDKAAQAYAKALDRITDPDPSDWFVFYAAGIADERSGNWERAESELKKALELNPGQPSVLNYLGYSYVQKGENLEAALEMIKEAVEAEPDSGYIVDSLGWALFQLGRYDEAVVQMERAIELESVDPLVNNHLGDAYWAVGRKREALFQWQRAISFGPGDDVDMERVQRKIDIGLDAVRAEEGAVPLSEVGQPR
ncbi:tetratricopeptide repeat protein [Rhodobacteraceae bacterium]|nr:tetratricopeptide repeat protein [Paracoccaceae bacterium]